MANIDEIIPRLTTTTSGRDLRSETVSDAAAAFFARLVPNRQPSRADVEAAADSVQTGLHKRLFRDDWLELASDGRHITEDVRAAIRVTFERPVPTLTISSPPDTSELLLSRIALAALVGAVAGLMLLTPLTRLLLGSRDIGFFVGPPIGAFFLVLAAGFASKSKWLRRVLLLGLGVATVAEVWGILSEGTLWGTIRRKLGGRGSALKRILLYIAIACVLLVTKRRSSYDQDEYEKQVRLTIQSWLDGAWMLLVGLVGEWLGSREAATSADSVINKIGLRLHALHGSSPENLPFAVDELIHEARALGFGGLDRPAAFLSEGPERERKVMIWQEELGEKFDRFGLVDVGDEVTVEREPVLFEGEVREKGLVRKVRSGR